MINAVRRSAAVVFAALSLVLPVASPTADADAEGPVTWMVRPSDGVKADGRAWVERSLDPGDSAREHLLLRNLSPAPVVFHLTAGDGYFTDTGRFNMIPSDQASADAGRWVQIQDTVEVPAGADVVVPFTIAVPGDATPGDHLAGVAASIRSGETGQIGVESRVGFRVMTRVSGKIAPAASVQLSGGFATSWNPLAPGEVRVDYVIRNSGNTRLSISPHIALTAPFGITSFNGDGVDILEIAPGESRSGSVTFPRTWPLFAYTAEVTASAAVVPVGNDTPPKVESTSASASVAAIPMPQLIFLVLAALLFWWARADRRGRNRRLTRMLEQAREEGRHASSSPADGEEHLGSDRDRERSGNVNMTPPASTRSLGG